MAFTKKTWVDRVTDNPNRRILVPVDGQANTYDVTRSEGTIHTEGDVLNAANLNGLEERIANALALDTTHALALNTGYSNVDATHTCYYRKTIDGHVTVVLNLRKTDNTAFASDSVTIAIATLPDGYRPAEDVYGNAIVSLSAGLNTASFGGSLISSAGVLSINLLGATSKLNVRAVMDFIAV